MPLTVVTGVNDTFNYTPGGPGGTPETFTVAAGVYSTLADVETAVLAATGSVSSEAFSTYASVYDNGGGFLYVQLHGTDNDAGLAGNASTITAGSTDISAALGFSSPQAFEGGLGGATGATQGSGVLYIVTATPNTGGPSGERWNVVYTTASTYDANVNDFVLVNTIGGGAQVNLPAAQYGDQIGVMSYGNKPCAVVDTVHDVPWFLTQSTEFPSGVTFIQLPPGDDSPEPGGYWFPILPTFVGDVESVDGEGGFVGELTVTGTSDEPRL